MSLEIVSLSSIIIFGIIAVILSIKEEKTKLDLLQRDRTQKQRLYEILVLKEIQERIGYSLDIEKIVDVITGSLKNFFSYSSASSMIIKGDKLIFKCNLEEGVSRSFIDQVKKTAASSLSAISKGTLPLNIEEILSGAIVDDSNTHPLASFFHIPLNVNGEVLGIINVASTKQGLYKEDEMTILYNITSQASIALSRLQSVLATEKGKLMAMIGSLDDGVFMVGKNNELLVINQAAKEFLNVKKDNPSIFDIVGAFPEGFDLSSKIEEVVKQNKKIEEKEKKIGERTVEIFITPVSDGKVENVLGVSVLLHDITVEKELSQVKEDFTNMMVHELRAPLTSIKQASGLMLTETMQKEEEVKFLKIIHEQSNLLLEDVSGLLDAAKIESGKLIVQKTPSDIKKIIFDALTVFEPQAKAKNVSLNTNFDDPLPQIDCDPLKIGQVLNNLISNSLKFTPEGGRITIHVVKKNNEVSISVSDNGIGIPKEKQEQLFSRFSQIDNPKLRKNYPVLGSGLGLYITKGIVQAHGGNITLESEINHGTTVSFTLPVHKDEHKEEPVQTGENPSQNQEFKSLLGTVLN